MLPIKCLYSQLLKSTPVKAVMSYNDPNCLNYHILCSIYYQQKFLLDIFTQINAQTYNQPLIRVINICNVKTKQEHSVCEKNAKIDPQCYICTN